MRDPSLVLPDYLFTCTRRPQQGPGLPPAALLYKSFPSPIARVSGPFRLFHCLGSPWLHVFWGLHECLLGAKGRIHPLLGQELRMGASLDHGSALENNDAVAGLNGAESLFVCKMRRCESWSDPEIFQTPKNLKKFDNPIPPSLPPSLVHEQ